MIYCRAQSVDSPIRQSEGRGGGLKRTEQGKEMKGGKGDQDERGGEV